MNNYSIDDLKKRLFKIVRRMSKNLESRVEIFRQSGLPCSLEKYEAYQAEYVQIAEKIGDRAGLDMLKSQRMYRYIEFLLKKKYESSMFIDLPQSKQDAMDLIKKFGVPITFAITANGNEVIGLLLDEM